MCLVRRKILEYEGALYQVEVEVLNGKHHRIIRENHHVLMQAILNAVSTRNPGEMIILNQNSMRVAGVLGSR